jgi:hypothetical protein
MSIEAMKQALEALDSDDPSIQLRAAVALRQAIEQAEKTVPSDYSNSHQPVAWSVFDKKTGKHWYTNDSKNIASGYAEHYGHREPDGRSSMVVMPLYAAPVHASDISAKRVDETAKDRHEPESNNVEAAAEQSDNYAAFFAGVRFARVNLPAPSKEWVGLTHEELAWLNEALNLGGRLAVIEAIEAKLKEKNT